MATFDDFVKSDIRVGPIIEAAVLKKPKNLHTSRVD